MAKTNPAMGDYLAKKFDTLGGGALSTRFENGEIVDRFSFLIPRPPQLDSGMGVDPCPFDTLKFTGPDTHLYWAASVNWKQYYRNIREKSGDTQETAATKPANPMANELTSSRRIGSTAPSRCPPQCRRRAGTGGVAAGRLECGYDVARSWIIHEGRQAGRLQAEIAAIIESVRQAYIDSAVIREVTSNGFKFATLKFVQPGILSPTITEEGPYLGLFLTENQAVRAFQRTESTGLAHNADFTRQMGTARTGAAQIAFLDSPYMLDRAYKTAMPYVSLISMFNKDLAAQLKDKQLPPDLSWLAPMGTWSCVITPDGAGIQGYSVSGIGNQGILLAGAMGGSVNVMQMLGILPKTSATPAVAPGIAPAPLPQNALPANGTNTTDTTNTIHQVSPPIETFTNMSNAPSPTNSAGASVTNSAPAGSPAANFVPDALTPPPEPAQPPAAH